MMKHFGLLVVLLDALE